MIPDNLDSLSDAALAEVFACEVANHQRQYTVSKGGFYYRPPANGYTANIDEAARYSKEQAESYCRGCRELRMDEAPMPPFVTSADAVLPFLPKEKGGDYWVAHGGFVGARVVIYRNDQIASEGIALTFARAACLALIRAKRASK